MRLLSVNVGNPRPNEWKSDVEFTGIDKCPVTAPGPKGDGSVGLAGARVGDVAHHGGSSQAVYTYSREDYEHFEALLGYGLRAGMFGENLTTEGHDLSEARIGERRRGADCLVLEVTCPRIPCGTFRGWMGTRGQLKTFTREARPGAYLSVFEPGAVEQGGELEVTDRPEHKVTIARFFKAAMGERDLISKVLEAPSPAPQEAAFLRPHYDEDRWRTAPADPGLEVRCVLLGNKMSQRCCEPGRVGAAADQLIPGEATVSPYSAAVLSMRRS